MNAIRRPKRQRCNAAPAINDFGEPQPFVAYVHTATPAPPPFVRVAFTSVGWSRPRAR
jgi:hypothetical protein